MKKTSLSKARVGLLIFLGVLAFTSAIFYVGQKSQLFTSVFYVQVNFSSAEGVKPGNYVVLSGYNVGTVSDISLTGNADSVRLLLRISDEVRPFIKTDSRAEIKQEGLVGNKFINISIGSESAPRVPDYGYIEGVPPFALTSLADNVTSITDTAKAVMIELNTLLSNLNNGSGTIGRLLTDDEIYDRLAGIVTETEEGLRKTNAQLDKLSILLIEGAETLQRIANKADTAMGSTGRITEEAATLIENINNGEGTLGALTKDRGLYDSLVMLVSTLIDVGYETGNAANQTANSLRAMREHWLFGRVFAGDDFEEEEPPASAYERKMRLLNEKLHELEQREKRLREREQRLQEQRTQGQRTQEQRTQGQRTQEQRTQEQPSPRGGGKQVRQE
ncbi:MAG: MlaD family protein [Bacteroidota bacterium]|nr:MlaD family protein [Bacteroidota bacterium]